MCQYLTTIGLEKNITVAPENIQTTSLFLSQFCDLPHCFLQKLADISLSHAESQGSLMHLEASLFCMHALADTQMPCG